VLSGPKYYFCAAFAAAGELYAYAAYEPKVRDLQFILSSARLAVLCAALALHFHESTEKTTEKKETAGDTKPAPPEKKIIKDTCIDSERTTNAATEPEQTTVGDAAEKDSTSSGAFFDISDSIQKQVDDDIQEPSNTI